jgi:hypothetical protein
MERDGGRMTLADGFPHIAHDPTGDCCGCIRPVEADARTIELRCNECGQVAAIIDRRVLEDLVWLVNAPKGAVNA